MQQATWNLIRETRFSRPGRAQDDPARAAVYSAALQQFEELMEAASTSGYASRPLALFYAASQAGRAIAAAWGDDPWMPAAHGLKHNLGDSTLRSTVRPDFVSKKGKIDSFSCVAAAAGQGTLTKPVELGALWASLPDLWEQDLRGERWRRPLPVRRVEDDISEVDLLGRWVDAAIIFQYERHLSTGLFDRSDEVGDDEFDAIVTAELAHYPTAEGWRFNRPRGVRRDRRTFDTWEVEVVWEAQGETVGEREWEFRSHAFEHRIRDQRWLRPDLNDSGNFLLPLMTWWALLYGLSMLARYHPAEWTNALRLDDSPEAVPLRAALDEALFAVPQFVLWALLRDVVTVRG